MAEAGVHPLTMSDKAGVATLVWAAHKFGVTHVVLCPGSRNAPFIISFSRSGLFTCHSIADERVAGFYALGMALASSKPVAVVCTSGSAGINLAPALAEAYYLKAPVIAITADRPLAWTDQGNGQTIRQEGLFANHICGSYTLIGKPQSPDEHWWNRRKIAELFHTATQVIPGPVHFNAPLSEPLYHTYAYPQSALPKFAERLEIKNAIDTAVMAALRSAFAESKKVMILLGQMQREPGMDAILASFATLPNVVVLSETTSNVQAEGIVTTIDRLIMSIRNEERLKALMPDVLITLGGMVVSKKIKALLRKYAPKQHWHIDPYDRGLDTYQSLSHEIGMEPLVFMAELLENIEVTHSTYAGTWSTIHQMAAEAHERYVDSLPWSDFKAFDLLLKSIKTPTVMHMANSSPVRYVQLFGMASGTTYHANRGTSGIDGSTTTAAGWAKANPDQEVLMISGDMAFMYDSNALWNKALPENLKIVVINNQGGGIFRIIEGPDTTDELEAFFEAHHPGSIEHIAKAYGLVHLQASDEAGMAGALERFVKTQGCVILEILTTPKQNAPLLKGYFKHIAAHISGLVQA